MAAVEGVTWLFTPGDRPYLFEKAAHAGADEVILDLEDSIAPESRPAARVEVANYLREGGSAWVRINSVDGHPDRKDVAVIGGLRGLRGIVAPKAEQAAALMTLRQAVSKPIVAVVETALGIHRAADLACSGAVDRLAFGSVDFVFDIAATDSEQTLLFARSSLVLASRVGGLPAPIDGITSELTDEEMVETSARRACQLGFGGKLCIHPRQLAPAAAGFRPSTAELAWSRRVVAAAADGIGVVKVDGLMVDRPVIEHARRILGRA